MASAGAYRTAPAATSADDMTGGRWQVDDELRTVGWVFIPATHRAGDPLS